MTIEDSSDESEAEEVKDSEERPQIRSASSLDSLPQPSNPPPAPERSARAGPQSIGTFIADDLGKLGPALLS